MNRPRLADHVLARRHRIDGVESVALHDAPSGRVVLLEPRVWRLLACADGTRDVDGVCLAAAREGAYRRHAEVVQLLGDLAAMGMLADGIDGPAPAAPASPAERPLEILPFRLVCDGSGGCCSQYASFGFTREEAERATRVLPIAGEAFLPRRGSVDREELAATLIDGRCAYLEGRLCGIHARLGAAAKPSGCRTFPATFVDDGETVRVSAATECACVFASARVSTAAPGVAVGVSTAAPGVAAGGDRGEPLATGKTRGDVAGIAVRVLPDWVVVRGKEAVRRAEIAAWSRSFHVEGDAAVALRTEAARLRGGPAPPATARLAEIARAAAESADGWRSSADPTRIGRRALAEAAARATDGSVPPRDEADEHFYVRAAVFGHHLAGFGPLADALEERAARIEIARRLDRPHPLALVDALFRGMTPT